MNIRELSIRDRAEVDFVCAIASEHCSATPSALPFRWTRKAYLSSLKKKNKILKVQGKRGEGEAVCVRESEKARRSENISILFLSKPAREGEKTYNFILYWRGKSGAFILIPRRIVFIVLTKSVICENKIWKMCLAFSSGSSTISRDQCWVKNSTEWK